MGHADKRIWGGSLFFLCVCLFLLRPAGVSSGVSTDGTLGPAINLSGPDYQISHDIGSLSGKNLFHSFEQFSIANGESATFTGPDEIANVISRVTGGDVSSIDGLLRSEVGTADFYFINPAGVVFGPNAQVDVPAAFHVSTADELRFENGALFSAVNPDSSSLSLSAPESFGFLSPQPAPVYLNGSYLIFKPGSNVTVSAGSISMTRTDSSMALLMSEEGTIRMTAVGDSGAEVPVSEKSLTGPNGNIDMDGAALTTRGDGGGEINLSAGDILVKGSRIHCDNTGELDATGGISIQAEKLDVIGSAITSDAEGEGHSAPIRINAKKTVNILNGGDIRSSVLSGTGNAGGIELSAKQLVIDGGGRAWPAIDRNFDIITGINSTVYTSGNAGTIDIQVSGDVSIQNCGGISSSTYGVGNAGNISLDAGNLKIDGKGIDEIYTGIISETAGEGLGGNIEIRVNEFFEIQSMAKISSNTWLENNADAGDIFIRSAGIKMGDYAYIKSNTSALSPGDAGDVTVMVEGLLEMSHVSFIESDTESFGNAGNVTVGANTIKMEGYSNIRSDADAPSEGGNGGSVEVTSIGMLEMSGSSNISTSTLGYIDNYGGYGSGDAGNVIVRVGYLSMDDQASISSDTEYAIGNANRVDLIVDQTLEIYNEARISSNSWWSKGNAGDINISATELKIDGVDSEVSSKSYSAYFSGFVGNISIIADHVSIVNGGSVNILQNGILTPEKMETFQKGRLSIDTHSLLLKDGSDISASSSYNAPASDIFLTISDSLVVKGTTFFTIEDTEIHNTSRISTEANTGDGGNIIIDPVTTLLRDGQITTSSITGSGGDISLSSDVLVLDTGFIQANAREGALGGDIFINADAVVASGDNLVVGGEQLQFFEPGSGLNIIQAAAPDGEQGNIDVTAPELDIAGSLVRTETDFSRPSGLATDPCSASAGQGVNSLVLEGRGGMRLLAEDLLDLSWNGDRLDRLIKTAVEREAK